MSSKKNQGQGPSKAPLIRSSAAEYLTFVAASGQGTIDAIYAGENVWLTQRMVGLLYDVDVRTVSHHLKNVFADRELEENSVIQYFRITAADGKIRINRCLAATDAGSGDPAYKRQDARPVGPVPSPGVRAHSREHAYCQSARHIHRSGPGGGVALIPVIRNSRITAAKRTKKDV